MTSEDLRREMKSDGGLVVYHLGADRVIAIQSCYGS